MSGPPDFAYADETQYYACSTIKTALVLAAYRESDAGRLDLDQQVRVHDDFDSQIPGERFRMDRDDDEDPDPWRRLGDQVALRWLCLRSIVRSSNLATNLVLERVGTVAVADALGAAGTTRSTMTRGIEDAAAAAAGLTNTVTARDLAHLLRSIAKAEVASPATSEELLGFLAAQQFNDGIPAGLPAGTRVAHKTGSIPGVNHDGAIIYPRDGDPYVLVVCTTGAGSEDEASALIARVAAASWQDRVARV